MWSLPSAPEPRVTPGLCDRRRKMAVGRATHDLRRRLASRPSVCPLIGRSWSGRVDPALSVRQGQTRDRRPGPAGSARA